MSLSDGGAVPEQLGEYRLLREVARGGMGIVYEAVQESLGRRVALKILSQQRWQSASYIERFRREARAAAQLHHTNIVPVFGFGEHGGVHYYAMQFIQGQSLEGVLREVKQLRGCESSRTASAGNTIHEAPHAGFQGSTSLADALRTGRFLTIPAAAPEVVGPDSLQGASALNLAPAVAAGSEESRPAPEKPAAGSTSSELTIANRAAVLSQRGAPGSTSGRSA
jgi:hypothetical protein